MKVKSLLDETSEQPKKSMLPIEIFSPWSNIIVKFKMPDEVFQELEKMYDYTMKNYKSFGDQLVGQIGEEPEVSIEIQQKFPNWINFCLQCTNNFIMTQSSINYQAEPSKMPDANDLLSRINTMWFVKQRPGEYNPMHIHTNCKISAIAYLRTPKQQVKDRKEHYQSDGKVTFSNNTGTDLNFANYQCSFEPKPGDMYVFPALQHHMVWPYRSADPNDERISISFNADTTTRKAFQENAKQQEKMYEEMKKFKEQQSEVKDDKSADVSNINKSG